MKSLLLVSAVTLALSAGCAHVAPTEPVNAPEAVETPTDDSPTDVTMGDGSASLDSARRPGDFVVHRFSGSYRSAPVEVSQRVLSRSGETVTIALSIEGGASFELEVDDSPARRGELRSVLSTIDGAVEPMAISDFEAIMAGLVLVADENDGLVEQTPVTMTVGDKTMAAIQSTYQVRVGEVAGVMHTFAADGFGWGDLGGQILGADGEVLYKAEVLQLGHGEVEVAAQSPDRGEEGLDIFDE